MAKPSSKPDANQYKEFEGDYVPRGTILFIILFVIALFALWGTVYWILISRGVTI